MEEWKITNWIHDRKSKTPTWEHVGRPAENMSLWSYKDSRTDTPYSHSTRCKIPRGTTPQSAALWHVHRCPSFLGQHHNNMTNMINTLISCPKLRPSSGSAGFQLCSGFLSSDVAALFRFLWFWMVWDLVWSHLGPKHSLCACNSHYMKWLIREVLTCSLTHVLFFTGGSFLSRRRLTCPTPGTNTSQSKSDVTDRWAQVYFLLVVFSFLFLCYMKCLNYFC